MEATLLRRFPGLKPEGVTTAPRWALAHHRFRSQQPRSGLDIMAPHKLTKLHGAAVLLSLAAGCYRAEPLDARSLLGELRAADKSEPATATGAAPPPVALGALSEERSVALALVWNRSLRAFRHTRGVAEGEVIAAGALENPELRTELTHLQNLQYASGACPNTAAGSNCSLGWDLRLTWAPPQPGVRAGKKGAASAHLEDVDRQISEREWALVCDVRAAHATLLAMDEQIRVAQDTINNRKRLSEVVGKRVQRGGTTRFDLDLVRLSLASAERTEGERRLNRLLAASALVQLVGVGPRAGRWRPPARCPTTKGGSIPAPWTSRIVPWPTGPRWGRPGPATVPARRRCAPKRRHGGPGSACRRFRGFAGTSSSAPSAIWSSVSISCCPS
jgi:hypothetical protein